MELLILTDFSSHFGLHFPASSHVYLFLLNVEHCVCFIVKCLDFIFLQWVITFWFDRKLSCLSISLIFLRLILSFVRVDLVWPYYLSRVFTEFPRCFTRYIHSGQLELKCELSASYVRPKNCSAGSFLEVVHFLTLWSFAQGTQGNFCAHFSSSIKLPLLWYLSLQPLLCQSPQTPISGFSTQWGLHALLGFSWVQSKNCLQIKSGNNYRVHFICVPCIRESQSFAAYFLCLKSFISHISSRFFFFSVIYSVRSSPVSSILSWLWAETLLNDLCQPWPQFPFTLGKQRKSKIFPPSNM